MVFGEIILSLGVLKQIFYPYCRLSLKNVTLAFLDHIKVVATLKGVRELILALVLQCRAFIGRGCAALSRFVDVDCTR